MRARPPQMELPNKIADIFAGSEEYLGPNAQHIIKKLEENQRFIENMWELPKESFTIDGLLSGISVTDSPRGKFRVGGRAVEFEGTLRDAGSSATHLKLYIDGDFVGTLIFGIGVTEASLEIDWPISRNSTFYVVLDTAGTDATGLVSYVHLIPNMRQGA
jgi:hypothetical protein